VEKNGPEDFCKIVFMITRPYSSAIAIITKK